METSDISDVSKKIMLQHFESGQVLIAWVIQPKWNTL